MRGGEKEAGAKGKAAQVALVMWLVNCALWMVKKPPVFFVWIVNCGFSNVDCELWIVNCGLWIVNWELLNRLLLCEFPVGADGIRPRNYG